MSGGEVPRAGAPLAAGRFRWTGACFEPAATASERTAAADSWLVVDGRTLALELHAERFARAAGTRGADAVHAAMRVMPDSGAWFPRVDREGDAIVLTVREAPTRLATASLWTAANDPRTVPTVKGPDLAALAALRALANEAGATEAVVTTPDGCVVEGAMSGIAWWRGDILHMPPGDFERVDSVTARCVAGIAAGLGIGVVEEAARPADLAGCEVWAMSALHGVRGVVEWVGGPVVATPTRAPLWSARLDALRRPAWT